jgi:hypothetical protein
VFFPELLQVYSGILLLLDDDCFLSNPFQFIIPQLSYHPSVHDLDTKSVRPIKLNRRRNCPVLI